MSTRTPLGVLLASVALAALVACHGTSTSPAAPSSASLASSSAASGGATIVGLVSGAGAPMTVSAQGTASTASLDPTGRFQLTGIPAGDVQLRFTATGVNASATVPQVGDQQRVELIVAVTGSTATITSDVRGGSDSSAEAEGMVTAVSGSCPTLALMIGAATIKTTAQTTFSGGTCTDVKAGVKLDVKGTKQTDGSITAQSVKFDTENGGGGDNEMNVEGAVGTTVSGACPTLTFMVNTTTVKTDASTRFSDGSCADVKAGVKVEVEGVRQTDGSLLAKSVDIQGVEQQDLEGKVTSIDSVGKTFVVSGKTVKVTGQTAISHGSTMMQFSDIKVGYQVHVKGTADASGAIVAAQVFVQNDNATPPTESDDVEGSVAGAVTGSCPSVTFTVKSTKVTTGPMTTYAGGTCADIKTGATVDVTGLVQPDKSLAASSVKFNKDGNGK